MSHIKLCIVSYRTSVCDVCFEEFGSNVTFVYRILQNLVCDIFWVVLEDVSLLGQ